jgi:hypothetical protein
MANLAVLVKLGDVVFESRVLRVKREIVLGDCPSARVAFPGAVIPIKCVGQELLVQGRVLEPGSRMDLQFGPIHIELDHIQPRRRAWFSSLPFDHRFMAVALVMISVGSWTEAAEGWLHKQAWTPHVPLGHILGGSRTPTGPSAARPAAALATVGSEPGLDGQLERTDGPRHLSDDRVTGVGYHRWFRRLVPRDPNAVIADVRLTADPDDAEARRIVAKAAYNASHFALASWHYSQVIERHPDDHHARLRMAWAERRQGHHQEEILLYGEILADFEQHPLALGGLSMALARLGHLDDASEVLDRLHGAASTHPYTDLTSAVVEAVRGQSDQALVSLRRTVEHRALLDDELQVELRRDVATDPAFSQLRGQWRLRAMLRRQLGAASPQGTR